MELLSGRLDSRTTAVLFRSVARREHFQLDQYFTMVNSQGFVDAQNVNGCAPDCCFAYQSAAVPFKMLRPCLSSGIEKWLDFVRVWIVAGGIRAFVQTARGTA